MDTVVTKPLLMPDGLVGVANALRRDRPWVTASVVGAACLHGGLAMVLPRFDDAARPVEAPTEIIDVEAANPPPPPPTPDPPPAPVVEPPAARPTTAAKSAAPSPLAQAGRVLAQEPSSDELADLTGFVQGDGATYAGGATRADGTRTHAVREHVAPAAVLGAPSGHAPSPSAGPNLSRRARIAGDSSWRCPFPPEATGIDEAAVELRVDLDSAGHVNGVEVTRDPGHGFGQEASRCVLDKTWQPALDTAGIAVAGTSVVLVRFVR
jgi:protein TonB